MIDLQILGVHPDGDRLILSDEEGKRYSLPITDDVRDAVRRDRPAFDALARPSTSQLRPRDIQALIRAGATAEEVARQFNTSVEHVQRYEAPIVAERSHAAQRARLARVGSRNDSPTLGDLVLDRLAARGVDANHVTWDATRSGHGRPWHIIVRFIQGAEEHLAHWSLEQGGRSVTALDQEAMWLTETATPAGPTRGGDHISRDLPQIPPPPPEEDASTPPKEAEPSAEEDNSTTALLDTLNAQRGIRQEVDFTEFEDDEDEDAPDTTSPTGHQVLPLSPQPHNEDPHTAPVPPESSPTDASDAEEPPTHTSQIRAQRRSKHRRSLPSWEEIMFGTTPQS